MRTKHTVIRETLREGRWFITLDTKHEESDKREMPKANYVWLCGNPAFKVVPKGYVIHHLDHDPLNDDISNLVLMQRHHHTAHHYKQRTVRPELQIDFECYDVDRSMYFPYTEPCIYKRKDMKAPFYYLVFFEKDDGKPKKITLSQYEGKRMRSKEDALAVKAKIWKTQEKAA